ncbi:hypothetical protein OSTOST_07295 [Ostertagia ostertagi]
MFQAVLKMRRCGICGKMIANNEAPRTTENMKRNAIWSMSLSLAGQMNKECARALADSLTQKRPSVCHVHLVHAAQYMLAEVVVAGKQISHFKDPKASGPTAYVSNGDIPEGLVSAMNRMLEGSVHITSRDVSKFINFALKRYYSTAMWPVAPEVEGEDVTEMKENGKEFASTKKGLASEDDVEKPCSVYAVSKDDMAPNDITECSSTGKSLQEAGHSVIKLKRCVICGKKLAIEELKSWSYKKSQNMILLFSLSLAGQIQPNCARRIAESLTKTQKICHVHVVQAAKYMLTEVVTAGNKISHFKGSSASERTAYVTNGDIPQDLISVLNSMAKVHDEDVMQLDQDEMPGLSEAKEGLSTEGDNTADNLYYFCKEPGRFGIR